MIKYFTKLIVAIVIICSASLSAKAQLGYNFAPFDLGLAGNINRVYGDAEKIRTTVSATFNVTYNATPYLNYVFGLQVGTLAAGDSLKSLSGRQFKNNFTAFDARVQLQAGEFIDYSQSAFANALKNLYVSTGIGLVSNNMASISRTSKYLEGFYTPGKDKSIEFYIPLRLGYEFKLFDAYNEPGVKIDLGYQVNFMMGENLDGFNAGSRKDIWNQVVLGVKFAVGGTNSYRKPINFQ